MEDPTSGNDAALVRKRDCGYAMLCLGWCMMAWPVAFAYGFGLLGIAADFEETGLGIAMIVAAAGAMVAGLGAVQHGYYWLTDARYRSCLSRARMAAASVLSALTVAIIIWRAVRSF